MKSQIILFTFLVTLISAFSVFSDYSTGLREIFTASVNNIDIKIIRNWSSSGGFSKMLAPGDKGQDVRWIQEALKTDRNIYPEGLVTGFFGNYTERAVRKFQAEYSLPVTGMLDANTKQTLDDIFLYELCPKTSGKDEINSLLTIVNKNKPLPVNYTPPNLQKLPHNVPKTSGIICLRKDVVPYLEKMLKDAQVNGAQILVASGFRSMRNQDFLFKYWTEHLGTKAKNLSAAPGHSEHQLGTTVDLTSKSMRYSGLNIAFANTPEGIWLQNNAHKYGFTMSYPKNKEYVTGYSYEPWHWRFVGIETATNLKNNGKTLSEVNSQKPTEESIKLNIVEIPTLKMDFRR